MVSATGTANALMVAIDETVLERLPQFRGRAINENVTTTEMVKYPYLSVHGDGNSFFIYILVCYICIIGRKHEQPQASETNQEQNLNYDNTDTVRLL
ncbi:hypothetical protein CW304_13625 [Bacillus sp. UFRGS-B20]|nr:hypothetical protein CW304_13625 [Bacillus sp. UFRGS-B20]